MRPREFQNAFEYIVNRYDSPDIIKSDLIFRWLNAALVRYVAMQYANSKESFETTQEVTDALKNIVEETNLSVTPSTGIWENSYSAELPTNYFHLLTDRADISFTDPTGADVTKRVMVVDTDSNTINRDLINPYSEHKLHYEEATPLRMFTKENVILFSDGNYTIDSYYLRYLRVPTELDLKNDVEYTDLPDTVHEDIIILAASLYLKSIGVTAQPREADGEEKKVQPNQQ